jgi:probable HAF family extracellular repeat protein
MHSSLRALASFALALFMWSATAAPQAVRYRVIDIGQGVAWSINDAGEATGISGDAGGAYVWSSKTGMVALDTFIGAFAVGRSINASGQVAGFIGTAAFLYGGTSGTTYVDFAGFGAQAWGLNDAGTAVGSYRPGGEQPNGSPIHHAFAFNDGVLRDLGTVSGGFSSIAYATNNVGQVVGDWWGTGRAGAFIHDDAGGMVDIGGGATSARAINDVGQVAGIGFFASGRASAFLFSPATGVVDIAPENTFSSEAVGINDAGQVVINAFLLPNGQSAFLHTPGRGAVDVNQLLQPNSRRRWFVFHLSDVNNAGQMAGAAFRFDGTGGLRAVVLTPVGRRQHR